MSDVRAVFGVPMYGDGRFLDEALDSLRLQRLEGVRFALVDDGLTPEAAERAAAVAEADERFTYERNPQRLGMLANWHRAFERARALAPEAEYFAWASDHDVWHPRFASELVALLDARPEAVAAHPQRWVVDDEGRVRRFAGRFASGHLDDPLARAQHANRHMSAGNLVYSLYRADALAAAGVYRSVLLPDRLLMLELSLAGPLLEHPEVLWYRRTWAKATVERQRATLWVGEPPKHVRRQWYVQHGLALANRLVLHPGNDAPVSRATGARVAVAAYAEGVRAENLKRRARVLAPVRLRIKRTRKFVVGRITMPLGAKRQQLVRRILDRQ